MATKPHLAKIMFVYSAGFPYFAMSEQTVEIYFRLLHDIPDEVLEPAFLDSIATADPKQAGFFPSMGAIRASATKIMTASATETHALEAWRQVNDLIREFGAHLDYGGREQFYNRLDPIAAKSIKVLGLDDYRDSDVDDVMSWRARFCEIYNNYVARAVDDVRMLPETKRVRSEIAERGLSELTKRLTSPTNGSKRQ